LKTRLTQEKHKRRLYGKILEHALSSLKSCIHQGRQKPSQNMKLLCQYHQHSNM